MAWYPKTRRIKAGHYQVYMGENRVRVWKSAFLPTLWFVSPRSGGMEGREEFPTKAEAVEWAGEWLKEHA